ncbi:MAG: gliding motility protein, partial [Spirosomaceae bacterium]|nr:gliding motility protein [Spirosomataceae bacterium]
MSKNVIYLFAICLIINSCGSKNSEAEVNPESIEIVRLDQHLFEIKSTDELQTFLTDNPAYTRSFYRAFAEDTAFVNHLFYIYNHPDSKKFYEEMAASYGDLSNLENELGEAFANIKTQFPDFKAPKVVATFTGLENDLYVSDSVIYIALEAFAGKTATYRPQQPDYILERYQKEYIVPTIIRFISDKYNISDESDNSLLNDMLYFGKAFEFTASILPDIDKNLIIAYPDSSMRKVEAAQGIIWAYFLDNQLLYEQNTRVKERYIGERPGVPEIGPACPG